MVWELVVGRSQLRQLIATDVNVGRQILAAASKRSPSGQSTVMAKPADGKKTFAIRLTRLRPEKNRLVKATS